MAPISSREKAFILLCGLFVSFLIVANIIATKIITVGPLVVPAAVFAYAFTFLITDTVAEIWGKKRAKLLVVTGFLATIAAAGLIRLAIHWPAAPFWEYQEEFAQILGANLRIVAASMVAYLISQYHDIWAFHFWKQKTGGRHLWLRNNLSTAVSQFLDTSVFIILAFAGTAPLLPLILGQYIIKLLIALGDTPFVYLLVKKIRSLPGEKSQEV